MTGSNRSSLAARAVGIILVLILILGVASGAQRGRGGGNGRGGGGTVDTTPPTAPTNVRATSVTQTGVTLAWDPSTDNSGQLTYVIWSNEGLYHWEAQTHPGTTYTGLLPGRTYSFTVIAVDPSSNRSSEVSLSVTLQPDTVAPTAPTLSVTQVSPGRAVIDWTPSVDDVTAVTYEVFVNGVQKTLGVDLFWRADGTAANVLGLAPSTKYTITVRAKDTSSNASPSSNAVSVFTPASSDTVAPTMPTGFCVTQDFGCGLVGLGWTQSTDDVTPISGITYEIYVNGFFLEGATVMGMAQTEAWNLTQPTNTITIVAFDSSGNASPPSTIIYN
jgi:chitodextrinase